MFAKNYEATARNEDEPCHASSVKIRASSSGQHRNVIFSRTERSTFLSGLRASLDTVVSAYTDDREAMGTSSEHLLLNSYS